MPAAIQTELAALRESAAFALLRGATPSEQDARAFLRITGSDATRWLNGMVTNNITALAPGEGNYNFLLNAQGRIQGDCTLYREPGDPATFLLATDAAQLETIQSHLDKFIIMDDVELTRGLQIIGNPLVGLSVMGRKAPDLIHSLLQQINDEDEPRPLPVPKPGTMTYAELPHKTFSLFTQPNEGLLLVFTPPVADSPRFDLWFQNDKTLHKARHFLESEGAIEASAATLEALRILEGTPRFGTDITDKILPQETAQVHALHFAKGCYLGQEIVERIHSRGQVHRTFTRFRLEGALPESLPAPLESNSKPAGELTSAMLIPDSTGDSAGPTLSGPTLSGPTLSGSTLYALGYLRRELLETRAALTYPGGIAVPVSASNASTHSSQLAARS